MQPRPQPGIRRVSRARQFLAVLHKNFILQTRSRRTAGLGGWGALLIQVLLPAAFFSLMCIPKHFIQPVQHPEHKESTAFDIDSRWWSGPNPYDGAPPATGGRKDCACIWAPQPPHNPTAHHRTLKLPHLAKPGLNIVFGWFPDTNLVSEAAVAFAALPCRHTRA